MARLKHKSYHNRIDYLSSKIDGHSMSNDKILIYCLGSLYNIHIDFDPMVNLYIYNTRINLLFVYLREAEFVYYISSI